MGTTAPVSSIAMNLQPDLYCEGVEVKCFPAKPAEQVRYTWYIDDCPISGLRPDQIAGDTLLVNMYNGMKVSLKATSTETCLPSDVSRETTTAVRIHGMHRNFRKISLKDTMLCADAPVQLWAMGVSYQEYTFPDTKLSGMPAHLIKYEDSVTVGWAENLSDVLADRFIHTGMRFVTSVDSARFGDRSADLYADSAVIGTQTFYAKIRSYNGCTGYDSIRVTLGYNRTPKVVIVPEPAFPWCEGNLGHVSLKIEADFLGAQPLYALGRVLDNGNTDWAVSESPVWPSHSAWCRKGQRVIGSVRSSMLTCGNPEGDSEPMAIEIGERPHAWLQLADTVVCGGDELVVAGYGCTESDYIRLSELGYTEDEMMAMVADNYTYRWVDASTGVTVSEDRMLRVRPMQTTRYTLYMNDNSGHCVETSASLNVRVAVRSAVDVVFTEAVTGREVPFSLCAGSDSTELYV
ncbi:MAG: hypothetical protein K2H70_00750, partial [Bacteroidales bacterium]|nr:hypothetical protein [Bacteroidales bacterium]